MGLFRNLFRSLAGKQKVTPIELGAIIATKILDDLGRTKSPFLSIDPIFKRLHPAVQRGYVIEKTAALLAFFTYHFLRSCHDLEFGLLTYRQYGGVISFRMCENEEFQEIFGHANQPDAERRTFEELADAFHSRGNFYLNVLTSSPNGDYSDFVHKHHSSLGIPFRQDSKEFWDSLCAYYQGRIARLWEVFSPKTT